MQKAGFRKTVWGGGGMKLVKGRQVNIISLINIRIDGKKQQQSRRVGVNVNIKTDLQINCKLKKSERPINQLKMSS